MKSCSLGAHSAQWNDTWEPTYAETGATREIALYIDGPVYGDKISVDRDALALAEPPPLVLRQNVDAFGTGVLEEELPD